jgi:hypothetical protein
MKTRRRFLTALHWDAKNVEDLLDHLAAHDLHVFDARESTPATRERVVTVICEGEER